jgi:hypothetical protein
MPFGAIVKLMDAISRNLQRGCTAVLLLIAASLASMPAGAQDQGVVYRWVDDQGEVHYGAILPPEFANRPHQILKNGLVIMSIDDPTAPPPEDEEQNPAPEPAEDPEAEARKRLRDTDRLLLLKYRSEEAIVEAMELEVANLDYDARQIRQERTNAQSALASQIREAADRQRAGMPDDPGLARQIASLRKRLRQNEQNHADLEAREEQIRGMFMTELHRYRFLRDGGGIGEPYPDEPAADSGP